MPDWSALLADPRAPVRLIYEVGESESPSDPFGRATLRLWSTGEARLDHRRFGVLRSWRAFLPPERALGLRRGVAEARFPTAPPADTRPGARRRIYARAGADTAAIDLPVHDLPPAWASAVVALDAVTTAVGGADLGRVPPAPDLGPGEPLRTPDVLLGRRWFMDPLPRALALRALAAGQSPRDALRDLPRAQEVVGRLDLRCLPAAAATLPRAHLEGADLANADLSAARLEGAHLAGAHLAGADLAWAHLGHADLRGADLRGALLADADLRDADLRDADLTGAELREADLTGARLQGARLAGTILETP